MFFRRHTEEQHGGDAEFVKCFRFLDEFVDREMINSGQRGDFLADVLSGYDEQRQNEIIRREPTFRGEVSKRGGFPQASQALSGVTHGKIIAKQPRARRVSPDGTAKFFRCAWAGEVRV